MEKLRRAGTILFLFFLLLLIPVLVTRSTVDTSANIEKIRAFSRSDEFDFVEWTIQAIWEKLQQAALGYPKRLSVEEGRAVIDDTLALHYQILVLEWQIDQMYSNPDISDPEIESQFLKDELAQVQDEYEFKVKAAEVLLQSQINQALAEEGISIFGQAFPPVLYRFSPLPKALIVSPRDVIRQDANLSIEPEISFDERINLEDVVSESLDVSTLVTDIGGVGTYPTMVYQTTDLQWLLSTIAHEWTHNYLTLRPLGIHYGASGETRTMNETTADIVGETIKLKILETYYPELLPTEEENEQPPAEEETSEEEEYVFDFAYEMYVTRRETDILLEAGKIEAAEEYMEARRQFFWENGYQIRKLNQAYFAFHAAYVNAPSSGDEGQTGAAGEDPVGPAVWQLFENSENLAGFLRAIAWVTSFEDLQEMVAVP